MHTSGSISEKELEEVLLSVEPLNRQLAGYARPINARDVDVVIGANIHPFNLTRSHINHANLKMTQVNKGGFLGHKESCENTFTIEFFSPTLGYLREEVSV